MVMAQATLWRPLISFYEVFENFPSESLVLTEETLSDVQAHYEYLAEHEEIMQKLKMISQ